MNRGTTRTPVWIFHFLYLRKLKIAELTRNYIWGLILVGLLGGTYLMPILLSVVRGFCRAMSTYTPGMHSMAFVTVPDMEVARKLSHGLVKNKLAACVNIIPGITSVYEWENKINEDGELLLMIKTATDKVDDVSKFVRENHPYDVAEVISSKIDNGNPPYLKWISDIVGIREPAK